MTADSPTKFVQTMAAYRLWAGRPSYGKMSKAIRNRYVPSTLSGIPNRTTLPSMDVTTAYLESCGADPRDIGAWQQAWRRLAFKNS